MLNQDERIAHVVLFEADDYRNGYLMNTVGDSTLYWYRKAYSACP